MDVTLLERNLALTLDERFQQREEMWALAAALRPCQHPQGFPASAAPVPPSEAASVAELPASVASTVFAEATAFTCAAAEANTGVRGSKMKST